MSNVVKKQNMTIAIREYTDGKGQQKKVWKTIGELITWEDGSQTFETWGPNGSTKGSVFEQQQQQQGGFQQQQQRSYEHQHAPARHQQPAQHQGGFQKNQSNAKINPQEPKIDFDEDVPF